MQSLVQQDIEDLTALQVTKTPTFFVNGRPETEPVAQFYFGADTLVGACPFPLVHQHASFGT